MTEKKVLVKSTQGIVTGRHMSSDKYYTYPSQLLIIPLTL